MDDDKTAIKLAPFSGKQTDWSVWREKFVARARRKGYKETLLGKTEVPAESATLEASDKTKLAARKANNAAYEDLLLLIDGEQASRRVALNIVRGAKTTELPDGDAALAWKRLSDKYEPKSAPSRLALKNEFTTKILKNANSDPDAWLTELEDLRVRLIAAGSKMDDEELLEHVLNNLPKEYEIVVSKLEDRLGAAKDPLTIEDVAVDDESESEELELAFIAGHGKMGDESQHLWIGDSGNSRHLTGSDDGMIDWVEINEPIKLADNKTIWARKKGTIPLRVISMDGEGDYDVEMRDVYFVPDLGPYNLFSITMALDKGFSLGNKGKVITLTKGSREIKFDRNIPTKSGWLGAVKMVPQGSKGFCTEVEKGYED